jgi:hypothetical protein
MKIRNLCTIAIFAATLTSCGADPGEKNTEFSRKLQGVWESGCVERVAEFGSGNMEDHGYSIRTWNFSSDKDFTYAEIHYSDSECQNGNEAMTLSGSGTYELGDDIGTDTGKRIKFAYTSFSVIIKNSDLADELTTAEYCGQSIWRVDETVSLFEKTCTDSDSNQAIFPTKELIYSDVIDINNDSMWMGKKDTPISNQKTEEIDSSLVYTKS